MARSDETISSEIAVPDGYTDQQTKIDDGLEKQESSDF